MAKKRRRGSVEVHAGSEERPQKGARPVAASRECADLSKGLQSLLGDGITLEGFREQHFEKKPLHISRPADGSAYYGKLNDLASPEALFSLMDQGVMPVYRMNMFRCIDGSTKETPDPSPQSVADVRRLFSEGWSIQWLQPQQEHDALAQLVVKLEAEFGSLVGVNAYLTPPGVQGLAPHWDDVEVFVLQLGGRKSWRLHRSTTSSSLPSDEQMLPRFSSGDLEASSLSPVMMKPELAPGDLLYFPRGTIHYAPNFNAKLPSVHLTISTFQRQTLYDLTQKAFEEAMSELWEEEEGVRRCLPWRALVPGSAAYPSLCSSAAKLLRRVADAVEAEAAEASDTGGKKDFSGCVGSALAELGEDFVKHRMPPVSTSMPEEEVDSITITTPASVVFVVDPASFALVPLSDVDDGSAKLVHHVCNSRRNHMMNHPGDAEGLDADGEGMEEGEEEELQEEAEEETLDDEEQEEEEEEGDMDSNADDGQIVSASVADTLRLLCQDAQKSASSTRRDEALESVLLRADVPQSAWTEVCGVITQLSILGLIRVSSVQPRQSKRSQKASKSRT